MLSSGSRDSLTHQTLRHPAGRGHWRPLPPDAGRVPARPAFHTPCRV